MSTSIDGFYAAYLTGTAGQGFAMIVFRKEKIVGVDVAGVKYDGTYKGTDNGFTLNVNVSFPPNSPLIQGGISGPQGDSSELDVELPFDFLSEPFLRVMTKHGPVNVRLVKLRDLND